MYITTCLFSVIQQEKSIKQKPEWLGRADLYISSETNDEYIEAKYKWVSMNPDRSLTEIFDLSLKEALDNAKSTRGSDKESTFLGVSFFPMYISESRSQELDSLIEESIEAAKNSSAHAVAWCFPQSMRPFVSANRKNYNPGVIMLASNLQYV